MIDDYSSDRVVRALGDLDRLEPDAQRAARLRARCRSQMRRTQRPVSTLVDVLLAGLGVVYLSAVILDVLQVPGML